MNRRVAWVPGYTMSSQVWREIWEELPDFAHTGVDLPGHGREARTPMPATLSEWAEHVVHRMRATGARDLVGLSFGSSVALQAALEFPGDIDRLVLAAPTLSGRVDDPHARAKYLSMATAMFRGVSGRELTDLWMADPPAIFTGLRRHPHRFEAVAGAVETHRFTELRTGAMATLARTRQDADDLRDCGIPVLLLVGDQDMPLYLANAEEIADRARSASLIRMPTCGHLPLLEEPRAAAQHLREFLTPSRFPRPRPGQP